MSAFKTIALIGRHNSPDVAGALAKMGDYLRKQGREMLVEKESAASNHVSGFPIADYDEIRARSDRGNAHGIDRLRAFVGRADPATERARVRAGTDLPAHAVQPTHHGQRPYRDRNLPETLDRCPASLRRAAAMRPSGGRPRPCPARGAYREVRSSSRLQLLRDVAPEAALERSPVTANAFAPVHSGLRNSRSPGARVSTGLHRPDRRDRSWKIDPGRRLVPGARRSRG